MKKTIVMSCMTIAAISCWTGSAAANSIGVDWGQISGSDALSGQLQLTIFDNASSISPANQVLFSFTDDAVMPANVDEITINGDRLFSSAGSIFQSSGVDFSLANNGSGMSSSGGDFTLSANSSAGGLDRAGEQLGVVFNLIPGVTLAMIQDKFQGPPWIYVNPGSNPGGDPGDNGGPGGVTPTAPVPEPTSMVLFGIGSAGLIGLRKRQRGNRAGSAQG